MKYKVPATSYLYSILTSGDKFENIIEQQVLMAEHGISMEYSDTLTDIEREIIVDRLQKKEKDSVEFELEKFKAYAKILGFTVSNAT